MTIVPMCSVLTCDECGKILDYANMDTDLAEVWGCGYALCKDCATNKKSTKP